MKKRVKRVNLMKSISRVVVVLAFLTAMLGIETQVVAQVCSRLGDPPPKIDYSNRIVNDAIYKQRLDGIINNASFIFEGRMIGEGYYSRGPSYLFEIEKVYRGGERLQAGTVEVLVGFAGEDRSVSLTCFLSGWHVIFAKEVIGYDTSAFDANNTIKLELYYDNNDYQDISCFKPKMHNIHSDGGALYSREFSHYTGFGLNFRTEEEVRNFLKTYCNLSPTDMPKADTIKNQTFYDIERAKAAKERSIKDAEERVKKEETKKEYYKFLLESRMKNQKEIDDAMLEFENASDSIRGRKLENEMNLRDSIINEGLQKKSQGEQKRGDTIATLTSIIRNDIIIKDATDRYLEFDIVLIFNHNVTQGIFTKYTELNL